MKFYTQCSMITIILLLFAITVKSTNDVENPYERKSKYNCVYWHKRLQKWIFNLRFKTRDNISKNISHSFENENIAAVELNRLCAHYGLPHKNPEVDGIPQPKTQCVFWDKIREKWKVSVFIGRDKTGKAVRISGQYWNTKLDASRMVNKICDRLSIPRKNINVDAEPMEQKNETDIKVNEVKSKYNCVYWHKGLQKWMFYLRCKTEDGGILSCKRAFENEDTAAVELNHFCAQYKLPHKNPEVNGIPQPKTQPEEALYRGVYRKKKKWYAQVYLKQIKKHISGGYWETYLDAAKMVNKICDDNHVPHINKGIGAEPIQQKNKSSDTFIKVNKIYDDNIVPYENKDIGAEPIQPKENKRESKYNSVYWLEGLQKWMFFLKFKTSDNTIIRCNHSFENEDIAAIELNRFCAHYGLPHKNPEMDGIPQPKKSAGLLHRLINYLEESCEDDGIWNNKP